MSKYVVIVFPDEAKAHEGLHALRELRDEGSIAFYDWLIAERDDRGALHVTERRDLSAGRTGLSELVDGLMDLGSGHARAVLDEVNGAFAEQIMTRMVPGAFAVFADLSEHWTAPIDVRMRALAGDVIRESRPDTADDLLARRLKAHRAEVSKRAAARETRKAEDMEARYEVALEEARARLQRTADKARRRLDDTSHEVHKKLHALHYQAEKAKPDVREHIEQHINELSAEFAERERKLAHAFALAQEALQPSPVP